MLSRSVKHLIISLLFYNPFQASIAQEVDGGHEQWEYVLKEAEMLYK